MITVDWAIYSDCTATTEDCSCPWVIYEHPLDGRCWHKACLGNMSLNGCGEPVALTCDPVTFRKDHEL